jgi:hypothetical protein
MASLTMVICERFQNVSLEQADALVARIDAFVAGFSSREAFLAAPWVVQCDTTTHDARVVRADRLDDAPVRECVLRLFAEATEPCVYVLDQHRELVAVPVIPQTAPASPDRR